MRSTGASGWASAASSSSQAARTCAAKPAPGVRRSRSGAISMKKPTIASKSAARRSTVGVPTTRSGRPVRRASTSANAASTAAAGVAPSPAARSVSAAVAARSSRVRTVALVYVCSAGRSVHRGAAARPAPRSGGPATSRGRRRRNAGTVGAPGRVVAVRGGQRRQRRPVPERGPVRGGQVGVEQRLTSRRTRRGGRRRPARARRRRCGSARPAASVSVPSANGVAALAARWPARSVPGARSRTGSGTGVDGSATAYGTPSRSGMRQRRTCWRSATAVSAVASAATSSGPVIPFGDATLYADAAAGK